MSTREAKTNILLVDDQPKNLLALEAVLEPLGQNLVKAHSGREALKHLLTDDFAAILLDVQMPEMDGFETAAMIKQRPRSRHIPIIFLTANNKDSSFVFKGYNVGAVDYMTKPIDSDVLRSKVSVFVDLFNKGENIKRQADVRREREVADFRKQSERRYRELADSVPHMVWTADASGVLTYCNRRWFELAGVPVQPEARPEFSMVLHPDDLPRFVEEWSSAVRAKRDWEGEFRFGSEATGGYRWHLVRALAIPASEGAPRSYGERGQVEETIGSWVASGTDIDDRKRADAAVRVLAEASSELAATMDYEAALGKVSRIAVPALGDVCVVDLLDEGGHVRRIAAHGAQEGSAALDEIVKSVPSDEHAASGPCAVIRKAEREVVRDLNRPGPDDDTLDPATLAAWRERGVRSFMCIPIKLRERAVGALTFFSVHAGHSGVRFGEAELTVAVDLARRASAAIDNAQLYALVQREKVRLEEVNRAKDEFLATLSHELRTPLNAILGWTQILRSRAVDESRLQHALETIERNAKSQAQLIADLLDVSRIIAGKLSVELVPLSLGKVVDECIEAARPAADAKRVELVASIDRSVGDVNGDRVRLQQVTMNLLSNALKFTPAGGKIQISVGREEGRAVLRVTDSGEGIAEEFLPYVFDRFRQADSSMARKHGGLGLGLSIVKHLVEVHGGSVHVASKGKGHGASFDVAIPTLAQAIQEERAHTSASPESDIALAAEALRGMRVVLAEDDVDGRELLQTMLESCGAKVTAYSSAAAAVEHIAATGADVLISDIGLPNEDGYELIRKVRKLGADKGGSIPAIALTAYASPEDRERALTAGFQAHVPKPIQPSELVRAIARLVEREGRRDRPLRPKPVVTGPN